MATSTRSRYFRLLFAVALIFTLMTPLAATAQDLPDWSFRTETPHDIWSQGGSWAVGTPILVLVNDDVSGADFDAIIEVEQTGPNPEDVAWWVNTGDFVIEPGDIVTVDDGTHIKDLEVLTLTIDEIDAAGDTISGTAPEGMAFPVHASDGSVDANVEVTAQPGGAWTADFSGLFDIRPGTWGSAAIFDFENDATQRSWGIPLPTIEAQPQGDIVQGQQLEIGVAVSVVIDDPANGAGVDWSDSGTTVPTPWDPSTGYIEFDPGATGFDVAAGQEITLSDGVTTKVLVVSQLAITDIDLGGDLVHGIASSGAGLNIWADNPGSSNRFVTAALDGSWTADFSVAWEGWDPLDIREGTHIDVWEGDAEGDTTRAYAYVPNPQFSVETPHQVWSHGDGWIADRTVTITVNDGATDLYSTTADVTAWGPDPWEVGWSTDTGSFEIQPGHFVTVDDSVDIVRTLNVVALEVIDVDESSDTITGSAPPNAWVDAHGGNEFEGANRRVQADGAGVFTVNFGVPGVEDWEQDVIDLRPGIGGAVQVIEDDGDSTHRGWHVADPRFGVDVIHEEMWATDWPIGATLDFQVYEPDDLVNPVWEDSMTVVDTTWGQSEAGYRFWGDFDVHGGQVITITDGATSRELIVSTLEVTSVDPDTDTYTGTVDATVDYDLTHEVCAWARDLVDPQHGVELCTLPQTDGTWTIDFSGVGEIFPGEHTGAYQLDPDGDQTNYSWHVPPWLYVEIGDDLNPDFPDRIHLDQWVFPVDVTNGTDTVTVVDADGDGWERIDFDVTPGETITATGNDGRVKSLYLEELSVDTVTLWNEDPPSTVYGSTSPAYDGGVQVTASADYGWWTERWVDAAGGGYEADFANPGNGWREQELAYFGQGGADDVYSGGEIRAHIWDADNDQVQAIWHATNPRIIIVRGNDRIEAIDFPKGEPLTIEVDDPAFEGIEFSETGIPVANPDKPWETLLVFELGDYSVPDVATVTALDETGTPLVETEVIAFTIDLVDPDADTISGTAPEGSEVLVEADGNWRYPVADAGNTWLADFSEPGDQPGEENPVDIGPGSSGGATLIAEGGSATTVLWSISNAAFSVDPENEHVWGGEFAPDAAVTITIDGTPYGPFDTDGGGWFDAYLDPAAIDIAEGNEVVVSDGETDKTHVVTALAISGVDEVLDQVSGLAEAGTEVQVWVNDPGALRDVTATDGTWTADFSGEVDLGPGSNGGAQQWDDDGDSTHVGWQISNPTVQVDAHHDGVWGDQWLPNDVVTIFINDVEHSTLPTDEWGNFGEGWDPQDHDIIAGDKVEATQGDTTKTHYVTSLAVTGMDVDTEVMTGTADGPFDIWVHDTDAQRRVDHDGVGEWTVNWSVPGPNEGEEATADLEPGTNGNSNECDDDGDCTWADWRVARPIFRVDPVNGGIWGHEWYEVATVTISIDGTPLETVPVDENGDWGSGADPADLTAGTVVEVSGEGITKTLTVTALSVLLVDEAEDAVSGTATAGSTVHVEIHDVPEGVWRSVVADGGEWVADFTDPISDETGEGSMDFEPGVHGSAYQEDADGDTTWIDWSVRFARIGVEPRSNSLWGHEWTPNASVDITINDVYHSTLPTDEWGDFGEGWDPAGVELLAETEIIVSDGATTKTHVVTPLAITTIDVATNVMTGTALPNHGFSIWVHDSDANEWIVADEFGDWTLDWTPQVDLVAGSNGNSHECDDDGDCTWASWEVPNPAFSVETPFSVWSHGEGWVEGRTLSLMVDDNDDPTDGVIYWDETIVEPGEEPWEVGWSFELEDLFEIEAGHFVSVYDGVEISKALWVEELEITDIDEDADTVSGTATPFATVEAFAWDEDPEYTEGDRTVQAGANGLWTADFANPGPGGHETGIVDIKIGSAGEAMIFDEDGDSTHRGWYLEPPPEPAFFVRTDGDEIWGHDWFGGPEVTITFDDDNDPTEVLFEIVLPTEDGYFEEWIGDQFDIMAGQYVVVTDGEFTKTHVVSQLTVTEVDVDADKVHGIATPGEEVFIGTSVSGLIWEHLNFQFGPDNRNADSLNEHLKFRQAVAHAIDRDLIVAEVPEAGYAIDSYVGAYLPELSQHAWGQYPYDPAAAAALIDELCAELGRDCVANPPVGVLSTSDWGFRVMLAELLVPMFDAAGIQLQLDLEPAELFFGDTFSSGTFDVGEWAWVGEANLRGLADAHYAFDPEERFFDPNAYNWGTPDSSVIDANTARFAELVGLMEATDDPALLTAYIQEAELILADQAVIIPLYVRDYVSEIEGPYRVVTADPEGKWTADFSQPWEDQDTLDIVYGTGGFVEESDEDGDATHAGWLAAAPSATVEGQVYLDGAPLPDVEVWTGPDGVFTCTDADGYFRFEGLSPVEEAIVATGPSYSDAGCGNTAFVDPDGMPLLVAGEDGLFLADGYEYVEFNVEYAAAIQFVRVEDISSGAPLPVDEVPIRAFDRNDEEFIEVFGHDPDPADYPAIWEEGIGELAWIDWTGAALDHGPGLAEMRYPYITDVLVLAELDPIQGAQSNADEFVENSDGILEGPEILFQIGEAGPVVTVDDVVMDEGDRRSRVTLTFRLSEPLPYPVTVTWTTEDGTALAGEDYKAATRTFTFYAGATTVTQRMLVLGDTLPEDDEFLSISLVSVLGAAASDGATVTLLNDDGGEPPVLPELFVSDAEVLEGDGRGARVGVTFSLSGTSTSPVTFTATTVAGSALPGEDYLAVNRTLTIGVGNTSRTVYIRIVSDTVPEPDEVFTVEVSNVIGATVGDGVGEVTIVNDD